ncbi:MAG: alpha/beta hydrolase [Phycisphaerales bacterium]|nr:alpha/beta hydrolase [Phycisphaerales bacterium]
MRCPTRTPLAALLLWVSAATAQVSRPQTPVAPFPYRVTEVGVASLQQGVMLGGSLVLPDPGTHGAGPYPAVVFHSGSGPQDRDETVAGHKPYALIADALARRGIASLRCDDRGVGASAGDAALTTNAASLDQLADDAAGLIAFLRQNPSIDPGRIGYVGHSEGGNIASILMARGDLTGPAVLLASPMVRGEHLLTEQLLRSLQLGGVPEDRMAGVREPMAGWVATMAAEPDLEAYLEAGRLVINAQLGVEISAEQARPALEPLAAELLTPHTRSFLNHDPGEGLAASRAPVLALFGGRDSQVLDEQNAPVARRLLEQWPEGSEVIVLGSCNHLFQNARSGSVAEYATLEQTMSPLAIAAITGWLADQFGLE